MPQTLSGRRVIAEQCTLHFEVLDNAFDNEVAVGELTEMIGDRNSAEDGLALIFGQTSLGDVSSKTRVDLLEYGVSASLGARPHDDFEFCTRHHFGQA